MLEFVQTRRGLWEADFVVERRSKRWTHLHIGGLVLFYAFIFLVLWLNDFK